MDNRLEERYIVIKLKDMDEVETYYLRNYLYEHGISTVDCVVVESDWPQYKATVESIVGGE